MTTTETKLVRLGDLGTNHVWFAGIGQPAGCDLRTEEGDLLELPHEDWADLEGTIDGGKWSWNGEGNPTDWKGNAVQKIVAFVPAG